MIDPQIAIRLVVATVATSLVGLERSRRKRNIGMRTFGLIGLGAAIAGVAATRMWTADGSAVSRVVQGMLAGVGFLGGGVIVRRSDTGQPHGVTTAAAIWVAAIVGYVAGLGEWMIVGTAVAISLLLLLLPEPADVERSRNAKPGLPADPHDG
jgi:putative Mg2+ transporter-C (MgtC) family protein